MSGYATLVAHCLVCHQLFTSNPRSVPSYGGEPICRSCIETVNRERAAHGRPLWPVADDAYEPAPESEI